MSALAVCPWCWGDHVECPYSSEEARVVRTARKASQVARTGRDGGSQAAASLEPRSDGGLASENARRRQSGGRVTAGRYATAPREAGPSAEPVAVGEVSAATPRVRGARAEAPRAAAGDREPWPAHHAIGDTMSDDERPADQTDARDLCTVAALAQPLQRRHGGQAPAAGRHLDVAKEYLARCERAAALAAGQPWPPKGRSNTKPRITTSTPNAAPPQVGLRLRSANRARGDSANGAGAVHASQP